MKKARVLKRILTCIAVVTLIVLVWQGIHAFSTWDRRYAFEAKTYEEQVSVQVKEIRKEAEKEPIYVIHMVYGNFTIPESVYEKYIGNGNNTITVRFSSLEIYEARSWLGSSFNTSTTYTFLRLSLPFEEPVPEFSNAEIEEVYNLLKANKHNWGSLEFPFRVDDIYKGYCCVTCLDEGAVRFSDWLPLQT